jgi:hypothetical protein
VRGAPGSHAPALVCNGINVKGETGLGRILGNETAIFDWKGSLFPQQGIFGLRVPDFSVFDPDGNLPLNLQRTGLTNIRLDFIHAAFESQAKSALAKFVLSAPSGPEITKAFVTSLSEVFGFGHVIPVFFTKLGTALLTAANLQLAQARTCILFTADESAKDWRMHVRNRYDAVIFARPGPHGSSPLYSLNELNPWIATARVITRSSENPVVGRPLRFRYRELSVDGFHVYRTANCSPTLLAEADIELLRDRYKVQENGEEVRDGKDFIAAELFLKPQLLSETPTELSVAHYWEQVVRDPVVPFASADRPGRLNHTYATLQDYITDFPDSTTGGY